MPRLLLLMRHGKSDWAEEGLADHDRPLAKRGKRDAEAMGKRLAALDIWPQVVITSPAKRARSTARRVVRGGDLGAEITTNEKLYFSGLSPYYEALAALPEEITVAMVVGHNPLLEELAHRLSGQAVAMRTATIAAIELDLISWSDLEYNTRGRLLRRLTPRAEEQGQS